jgi:hypothetical protein
MLDKPQLELIKGLIDMNLGEPIEEFEKPSSVIRDPIAQVSETIHCPMIPVHSCFYST